MIGWSRGAEVPADGRLQPAGDVAPAGAGAALGDALRGGLVAGYGPIEVYGFHGLEALQVMMERRKGGETGVKAVTCLTGKDVWKAGDAGRWSWDLLDAALGRSETVNLGDVRKNAGSMSVQGMPPAPATAFLIEYRDGSRGTVLLLNGHVQDFCFAGRIKGEAKPASCLFLLPPPPGAKYFDALTWQHREDAGNRQAALPGRAHPADDRHPRRASWKATRGATTGSRRPSWTCVHRPGRQRFPPRRRRRLEG